MTLNMDEVQEASASSSAPTTRERESDSLDSSPSGGSDCSSLATKGDEGRRKNLRNLLGDSNTTGVCPGILLQVRRGAGSRIIGCVISTSLFRMGASMM